MSTKREASKRADLANGSDSNPETIASFSSLKNHNNAISTKMKDANATFYKGYQSANSPTPEPDARKNYRTYPYDYFSGIDAKVFFGDVWVDDIVTLQYSVSQNKIPIYGYASQLYDAIARGTVIVQGSITISFKEMGYLNMVQRIIETQREGAKKAIEDKASSLRTKASENRLEFIPNLEGSLDKTGNSLGIDGVGFSPNGTAQIIRKSETIEEILKRRKTGNVVSSGLGAVYLDDPNGTRDFEDFAEILEDTVWGDSNGHVLGKELKYRRPDEFDYNYANNKDAGGIRVARGNDYSDVLNIMITFGDMNDFRAEHTVTVLNDVHFTSQSTIIAPTGEPIGETYTFIARDVNQSITASTFNIPPIKFQVGQDINISKLQDVQEIEKFLNFKEGFAVADIASVASFDPTGWVTIRESVISTDFQKNNYEPLIDQLIRVVERAINDPVYSELNPSPSQHIIEVVLTFGDGSTRDPLRFVVEQQIKNTLTYKVISPTRNNFAAVNIFSREDMWGAITEAELAKKQAANAAIDKQKQLDDARKVELANQEAENKKKAAAAAEAAAAAAAAEQQKQKEQQAEANAPQAWAEGLTPEQQREVMSVKGNPNIGTSPYDIKDIQNIASKGVRYEELIAAEAARRGIPAADLKAIAAYESNFNPQAQSSAGAQGLFQVIPKYYGPVSENAAQQIAQGADAYQQNLNTAKKLNQQFDTGLTDYQLSVAVYNYGSKNVKDTLASGGTLPKETRDSIAKAEQFRQFYSNESSSINLRDASSELTRQAGQYVSNATNSALNTGFTVLGQSATQAQAEAGRQVRQIATETVGSSIQAVGNRPVSSYFSTVSIPVRVGGTTKNLNQDQYRLYQRFNEQTKNMDKNSETYKQHEAAFLWQIQ